MRCAKLGICLVVVVGTGILSFALGAERKGLVRPPEKVPEQQRAPEDVVLAEEYARLNAVLSDDGHWAIAGVVALSKDADGRIVIVVKKDGDFERDMVLTLPVRVIELDSGEAFPGGITRESVGSDTLTLYMEDMSVGGVAAGECWYSPLDHLCHSAGCSSGGCSGSGNLGCSCETIVKY